MIFNKFSKLIILILSATLASACNVEEPSSSRHKSSSSSDVTTSESQTSSEESSNSSKSSSQSSSNSKSSSSSKSSSTSSIASSSSGSSNSSNPDDDGLNPNANPILGNYTLKSDITTCDNHDPKAQIIFPASIISRGVKRYKCANCGGFTEEFYYDLDECAFESKTFMYDGNERTLYIEGILPHDVSVRYTNNTLTEIGSKEAKAEFYNNSNQKIGEKTATIKIIENIGLPNVKITTATGQDPDRKEKVNYTEMTATVDNCDPKWALTDEPGGIRIRGNSTKQEGVNKLAWRLKFTDKVNMFGLNGGKKGEGFKSWVVLADNFDYSYFRNMTAFNFGNSLFNYSNNYCSHYQHINFYMNGEYRGIYLLAEQQQSNNGRFSIEESEGYEGTDVGYLIEIDGLVLQGKSDGDYTFKVGSGSMFGGGESVNGTSISQKGYVVKTDVFGNQQGPFIENYVKNLQSVFIDACKGNSLKVLDSQGNIIDSPFKTQYETLNSIMDLDSFFRTFVLQEFMKNYDCGWGSFYLFIDFSAKSKHTRFTAGGPWDFDLGLGNKKSEGKYKPDGDFITKTGGSMTEFNPWLFLLSQTDFFNEQFERYYQAFANSDIYEQAQHDISYETSAFASDFANEYTRWGGDTSGRNKMNTRSYTSHQDAVNYLSDWLSQRKTYLDSKWLGIK